MCSYLNDTQTSAITGESIISNHSESKQEVFFRYWEQEQFEGIDAFKGILNGLLFSVLLFWLPLGLIVTVLLKGGH